MDLRSKLLDVASGIALSCSVTYILNIYIPWAPDLDICLFSLIILLNSAQFFAVDIKPSPIPRPLIMVTKSR